MNVEGGLVFDLYRDGPQVSEVKLHSARPLQLVNVLRGKATNEGLALLGMMYRICGVAQRYAGLSAWRRALDVEVPASLQQAQQLLVKLETLREHLWQVLVIWPELLSDTTEQSKELSLLSIMMNETERALFAQVQGMAPTARLAVNGARLEQVLDRLSRLIEQNVCGMSVEAWCEINTLSQLQAWAEQQQTSAARMIRKLHEREWQSLGNTPYGPAALPAMAPSALESILVSEERSEFVARPMWQGNCCETNTYTRQVQKGLVTSVSVEYGSGLLARMVARLVELVGLAQVVQRELQQISNLEVETDSAVPGGDQNGQSAAIIEAARGHLIHWLKLEQGVIADYAILAPTEWNFHPQGVAVQGLKTLAADDEQQLKQQAALWINAIDPCVAYELRIY
jgi:coenzyme F420-reducing hydrogenase alpha subunit